MALRVVDMLRRTAKITLSRPSHVFDTVSEIPYIDCWRFGRNLEAHYLPDYWASGRRFRPGVKRVSTCPVAATGKLLSKATSSNPSQTSFAVKVAARV